MVSNIAPLMRDLEQEDIHLLSGVEHGMRFSEWVNRNKLPGFASMSEEEVDYRLDRCADRELIERQTIQYEGYRLKFEGYDALALHTFVERGTLNAVGAPLGEGKESDVLAARNDHEVALKFHREGITNFREVQRSREYTADRSHISWLYTARKAAEREYEILETLHPEVSVPKPIDQNRHALVMELIQGVELSRADLDHPDARDMLDAVLDQISLAYELGIVHADISQYNVFVSPTGVTLFDWPQAIGTDHPNAEELLTRDIENILSFFARKWPSSTGSRSARDLAAEIMQS